MKKRLLSLLLVFVMVLGMLPTSVFAADLLTGYNFTLTADKTTVKAGEDVTLEVKLDKTIPASVDGTMIQFELWYDSTVMKEKSMVNGADYQHVSTGGAENDFGEIGKGVTTFGWCADDNEPVDFPAGTLATIVYTAKEDISVESLKTKFSLELYVCDHISNDLVVATPELEITVTKPAQETLTDIKIIAPDSLTPCGDGTIYSGFQIYTDYEFSYETIPAGLETTAEWKVVDGGGVQYTNSGKEFTAWVFMEGDATLTLTVTCGDTVITKTLTLVETYTEPAPASATVYMTVSNNYDFIEANGTTMALVPMTVPYFDIALYGLEGIYYNPDCYTGGSQVGGTPETAEGVVTVLHAIIWATEVYYNGIDPQDAGKGWLANEGNWNGFSITTSPGSAFMNFWDFGYNLNYYVNYENPLGRPGWGATADQIAITDGDILTFRYNGWTGDDGHFYHFGQEPILSETVTAGDLLELDLCYCSEKWSDGSGATLHKLAPADEIILVIASDKMEGMHHDADVAGMVFTDENGHATLDTSILEPGTYYITSATHDPAVMLLTVKAGAHKHDYTAVVTKPTCTEGGYTTHTCECGDSYIDSETEALGHSYVAGVCERCGDVDASYVAPTVTVYFSISHDDQFAVGPESGTVMALQKVTVPYFDLGLYGLENFYFVSEVYGDDGDGLPGSDLQPGTAAYADGKITMLHLFIYATEVYYCGLEPEDAGKGYLNDAGILGTEVFDITGSTGSTFLNYIWDLDLNLNYYLNYEYPLASAGWGSTSDQILLHDGDIVTLGHFSSWSFFSDPTSIFNYISCNDQVGSVSATVGDELTLNLFHAGADWSGYYGTAHNPIDYCPEVFIIPASELASGDVTEWIYLGQADETGTLTLDTSEFEAGDYVIALAGQYGTLINYEICSTPGAIHLELKACTHESFTETVTDPTCTEGGYTTHTCKHCGYSYTDSETEALGHEWDEGKVTTEPTCCKEGVMTYTCKHCGETKTAPIACTDQHNWEDSEIIEEPTCTKMGKMLRKCTECGKEETVDLPALGHIDENKDGACDRCDYDMSSAQTGDRTATDLLALLMLVSCAAAALLIFFRKRQTA